ncbi:hypothetical protein niasHT_028916 [Heterodera trifolii]|uniref:Uncharacterized protein n=1 Tax=Heterodera trifolii TaxID=157864 RepID=A0ABD2KFS3_9BILA
MWDQISHQKRDLEKTKQNWQNNSTAPTNNNHTPTSPAPPVIERIEIRLVDTENKTDETPLIIVDVVKKNGSEVAATIEQSILAENPTLNEQVGVPAKPKQSFLLRLHQPNYHSVLYIPFETNTSETTKTTTTISTAVDETIPFNAQFDDTTATIKKDEKLVTKNGEEGQSVDKNGHGQLDDTNGDKMAQQNIAQNKQTELVEKKNDQNKEANDGEDEDEAMTVEEDEDAADERVRDEFLVNESAILGETQHTNFNSSDAKNFDNFSFSIAEHYNNMSKLFMQHNNSRTAVHRDDLDFDADEQPNKAVVGQKREEEKQKKKNTDQHHHHHDHYQQQPQEKEQKQIGSVADQQIENQPQGEEGDGDEECLANRAKLSRETVNKLRTERRRIVQSIRRINRQQRELCRPDLSQNHVPYRKCPMWRREKFFLYYAFMRITYCSNHERWPSAKKRI